MSQEMILWVVRLVGVSFSLFLLYYARQIYLRRQQQLTALLAKTSDIPSAAYSQQTSRLSPSFFSRLSPQSHAKKRSDMPSIDLPLSIMARIGQHFTGDDINAFIKTYGFQRSPHNVYELLNENGLDILFSMLNIHAPGIFAQDIEHMAPIDGVLLVLRLPNYGDAVKNWDNFLAIATDMVKRCGGRLCDYECRPVSAKDLQMYRHAAEDFQKEYEQWLVQQQK